MRSEKSKAAAITTASKNIQRHGPYSSSIQKSSGKLKQIGNLLLTSAAADLSESQRLSGWPLFERQLKPYYRGKTA